MGEVVGVKLLSKLAQPIVFAYTCDEYLRYCFTSHKSPWTIPISEEVENLVMNKNHRVYKRFESL